VLGGPCCVQRASEAIGKLSDGDGFAIDCEEARGNGYCQVPPSREATKRSIQIYNDRDALAASAQFTQALA